MSTFSWLKNLVLTLSIFIAGCFGSVDIRGSVSSYENATVHTEGGGSFKVGELPHEWQRQDFEYRAIYFKHQTYPVAIEVDAFCKGSLDDGPLPILSNQLYYGMTKQHRLFRKSIVLDGREAIRTLVSGKMDGVVLHLDTVVVKKHGCLFDFAYISAPEDYDKGVRDFENFYQGFQYIQGP